MTLIIDSFAWIEFLRAGTHGERVREVLEGDRLVLTPDLVLAEVSRKLARDGVTRGALEAQLGLMTTLSSVAVIDLVVALTVPLADRDLRTSARARGLRAPGLGDATVLAMARRFGGKVLTGDPHFEGFPEAEWLG